MAISKFSFTATLLAFFFIYASSKNDNRVAPKCRCSYKDKVREKRVQVCTGVRQYRVCWEVAAFHSAGSATILMLRSTNGQFHSLRSPRFARTAGRLFYCRLSICSFYIAARPAPMAADEENWRRRVVKAAPVKEKKVAWSTKITSEDRRNTFKPSRTRPVGQKNICCDLRAWPECSTCETPVRPCVMNCSVQTCRRLPRERECRLFFFLPVRFSSERLCTRSLMGLMEAAGPLVTHAGAWLIFSHTHKYKDVKQEQQAYLGSPPGPLILFGCRRPPPARRPNLAR